MSEHADYSQAAVQQNQRLASTRFSNPEGMRRDLDAARLHLVPLSVQCYNVTMVTKYIERVQTGIRMEKRLLKVLKGLAEYHDLSLGDLLEGIVLHAFEEKRLSAGSR